MLVAPTASLRAQLVSPATPTARLLWPQRWKPTRGGGRPARPAPMTYAEPSDEEGDADGSSASAECFFPSGAGRQPRSARSMALSATVLLRIILAVTHSVPAAATKPNAMTDANAVTGAIAMMARTATALLQRGRPQRHSCSTDRCKVTDGGPRLYFTSQVWHGRCDEWRVRTRDCGLLRWPCRHLTALGCPSARRPTVVRLRLSNRFVMSVPGSRHVSD